MRSQLTRSVFRALIANQPLLIRGCKKSHLCKRYGFNYRYDRVQSARLSAVAFSNFFGFGPKKRIKTNAAEPGLEEMTNLTHAKSKKYQIPERAQILEAFRSFFISHCARPRNITASQLAITIEALKFLQERPDEGAKEEDDKNTVLSSTDYLKALQAIADIPSRESIDRLAESFASLLFEALIQYAGDANQSAKYDKTIYTPAVKMYVEILTRTGFTGRARDVLKTVNTDQTVLAGELWKHILNGFLVEGNEQEALETLETSEQLRKDQITSLFETVNLGLVERGSLQSVKQLYTLANLKSLQLGVAANKATITLCLRLSDLQFGDQIIEDFEKSGSAGDVRYLRTIWSARVGSAHQILDKIHEQHTEAGLTIEQEKDIVNALIEYYAGNGDSTSLDECLTFWEQKHFGHSSIFLLNRVQFWLDTGNLVQAYRGYHMLQSEEISPEYSGKATWLLSRLLTETCLNKEAPFEQVTELLDALVKQNVFLKAETVAAVCHRLLLQKELPDTAEFLSKRIGSYSASERALIQQEILRICTDGTTEDIHAWDVYELFRHAFPEASVEIRTLVMRSFFKRGRGDLACLVFGHMRQMEDVDRRPTADTYADCFMGIAKEGNKEGLNLVHNMLKLDIEVTPTVKVINSLMAAYAGCGMAWRSLEFFEDLLNSRDGPNHNSFALAFRACETYFGDGAGQARGIMDNLKKTDVDLTKEIYVCYIGAMAANNCPGWACELIDQMESAVGEKPDAFVIGSFYNAMAWDFQKEVAEKWASKFYPDLWEELSRIPRKEDEWGSANFEIDRFVPP